MILAAQRGKRIVCDPADGAAAAQGCYFVPAERDLTFAEMGRMMGAALGRRRTCVLRLGPFAVWTVGLVATAFSQLRGQAWYFNLDKAREARAGSWTCSVAAARAGIGVCRGGPLEETAAAERPSGIANMDGCTSSQSPCLSSSEPTKPATGRTWDRWSYRPASGKSPDGVRGDDLYERLQTVIAPARRTIREGRRSAGRHRRLQAALSIGQGTEAARTRTLGRLEPDRSAAGRSAATFGNC